MPGSLRSSSISSPYLALRDAWRALGAERKGILLDGFAIEYAYGSGRMENENITYHDTKEVFEHGRVSSFTGDVRTLFEIQNLRQSWRWLIQTLPGGFSFDANELCMCHQMLTQGTYDDRRWDLGERPGAFKRHPFEVADGVGYEPEDVPAAIEDLLAEVREARGRTHDDMAGLTIAAYAHATLVDIHPFADGNGRLARQLMNMLLMSDDAPPIVVPEEDRMAYFGALDAFHYEGELLPFEEFLAAECLKTWLRRLP